jgi:type I restriction enzyme R subunit
VFFGAGLYGADFVDALTPYTDPQKEFLTFVLSHYIDQGVEELDQDKLPDLL